MSEIYEVGGVSLDLDSNSLEDVSKGKLRNLRVAFREASRLALGDPDIASARSKNIRDISKKMSSDELVDEIKKLIYPDGRSRFDFKRAEDVRKELEKCTWLTPEQREKISVTAEYIEIDGIKIKLSDEPGEQDNEGRMFRGDIQPYTLKNEQWQQIIDFIGDNPTHQYQFFYYVLGMQKTYYVTASEPEGGFSIECILIIDEDDGVSIQEDWSEGPENWTGARFMYPTKKISKNHKKCIV